VSGEEKHLTIEQIERLLEIQPGAAENSGESHSLGEVQHHLANCDTCQRLVSMEMERDLTLRGLRQAFSAQGSGSCPTETRLYELAAGLIEDEDSEGLVTHVTECDRCGPMLRQATEQLSTAQTDQEAAVLASLKSSRPEWQARFGKRLASTAAPEVDTSAPARPSENAKVHWRFATTVWAIATSAAIAVSILTVTVVRRSRPSYAENLLAMAYSAHRTLDIRIPGAVQAPLPVNRGSKPGPQNSNLDKPQALLEAENLIAKHLRASNSDVAWLQAKVRADLLDGNYDSAIRTAERALDLEPNSPSLLSDLGAGYFERAENEQNEQSALDYGRAYEFLSKSLATNPNDLVALFNRAVVAERAHLYRQAESDWNNYLQFETDSAWQSEARARLTLLEKTLRENKDRSQKSLDGPGEVAEALSSGQQERIDQVDSDADEYLKLAVEEWIPQLTSVRVLDSNRRHSLQVASTLLGEELRIHHGDSWLSDFLSGPPFAHLSKAMDSLVRAVRANAEGNHEMAIRLAGDAEAEFQRNGSESGRIRAALETVYSNRSAAHGKQCYDGAKSLIDEAHDRSYVWIEVQTRLEAAACAAEVSRIDESVIGSRKALEIARSSKYGNLELRAIVFAADLLGDPSKRFSLIDEGLVAFWAGRYEPTRGYSLYSVMDTSADDLHLWFWDVSAIKEGLHLIETNPDLALRGLEQYRLARAQLAVGDTAGAQRTSAEARLLLEKSGSQTLITGASIDLAEAFVIKRRYQDALQLLASAQSNISHFTQDVVLAKFYSTRAAALLGDGQEVDGERALASALRLAQKGLASISEEPDRFSWVQNFQPIYRSLAYLELQKDVEGSLSWWESFKGASVTKSVQVEDASDSPAALRPKLPSFDSWSREETLLLSYATFPDGIAVWVYDGNQVHGRWLPGSTNNIDLLVRRFYEGCADRNSDPNTLLIQGRELYDLLIQPAWEWMQGRSRLIIETDDLLESVPFEALLDKQGKYLSDSYEIEYSPGILYIAQNQRSEHMDRRSHALVIGQSLADMRDGLPPLSTAADEAHEVAARFEEPVLLLDNDARLSRVVEELPRAEIFHFAGHAIGSRQSNGLLLASSPDGESSQVLDFRNFDSQLLSQSHLVVLSACSTANGIGIGINDSESLARNALAAGVPNVVASRWLVDSLATREWMKIFYAKGVGGERISSAAKQARSALKASKEWRHPYYWATFSVFV
jgi:CHAT domain-containing protein/tetratricopeptide (TPR) repeat protein